MEYKSYNTHHAPWGAFSSFMLGEIGKGGGLNVNEVKPPNNNVYVGYKDKGEQIKLLPFCYLKNNSFETAFGLDSQEDDFWTKRIKFFSEEEITRRLDFASDYWSADKLSFKIYTPFGDVPNIEGCSKEEFKKHIAPGILAELTLDNTNSDKDSLLFFGLNCCYRMLGDFSTTLAGGACVGLYGFAAGKDEVFEDMGFNPIKYIEKDISENYRLGSEVVIKSDVKAGERKTIYIALATYQHGIVTSGLECKFVYSDYFKNLEDVLYYLLVNKDYYIGLSNDRDNELNKSGLSFERKQLLAQAVHSYHASTQLLLDENNKPVWIVNEGEYKMMNTLDLTVDHLFFELKYHSWTIKNVLEFFWDKYSYNADIIDRDGAIHKGGISFCHDCGGGNAFSRLGNSSYEFESNAGCFSYMTIEELLNFTLCAAIYAVKKNDSDWKGYVLPKLKECFASIIVRDANEDGILDCDCVKCKGGYEITTYDSLDTSLSQARNNLYIAVKTFGTMLCLNKAFKFLGDEEFAKRCFDYSKINAKSICSKFIDEEDFFPSVFEGDDVSKIIPAIEGLIYPYYIDEYNYLTDNGEFGELIVKLKKHFKTVMIPSVCIEPNNGGWKLSSNNVNTWMSKIFISQFVAGEILKCDSELDNNMADKAHLSWQLKGCSGFCAVDQVNCENGSPIGSRLYPRLVTSILWLN